MNKEFKKILKQVHITNEVNFSINLEVFLDDNPNITIINTIVHKPYHVTIIYSELIEIQ